MNPSVILPVAMVVVAGAAVASQPAFNGQLAGLLGSPFRAALVNFVAGTVVLLAIVTAITIRDGSLPSCETVARVPKHLWVVGGALGALFVTTAAWATPKIGAGAFFATLIAAQLVAAMLLDHFGLLGLQAKAISWARVGGALMLVVGATLVVRG